MSPAIPSGVVLRLRASDLIKDLIGETPSVIFRKFSPIVYRERVNQHLKSLKKKVVGDYPENHP